MSMVLMGLIWVMMTLMMILAMLQKFADLDYCKSLILFVRTEEAVKV